VTRRVFRPRVGGLRSWVQKVKISMQIRLFGIAAVVALGGLWAVTGHADDRKPIGAGANELPLFDAHMHYKREAWAPYPPGTVIELMDTSGVAMALVSSTPDDGTIRLLEHAPARIVPEMRPYHGDAGSANWTTAPGMLAYINARLDRYPHQGIGEFHIHALDLADKALLAEVAGLAAERAIPLHIHSGAGPVEFFYSLQPSLTVIWAHAGMSEPAEVVARMMDKYPSLHADTSYREHDILGGGGRLDPAWERVLMKHSSRFMIGTDTWTNSQWENYGALIDTNRSWLALLPRAEAQAIAYRNAERLFGRHISDKRPTKR